MKTSLRSRMGLGRFEGIIIVVMKYYKYYDLKKETPEIRSKLLF